MTEGKGLSQHIVSVSRGGSICQKLDGLAALLNDQPAGRVSMCTAILAEPQPDSAGAADSADPDDGETFKPG